MNRSRIAVIWLCAAGLLHACGGGAGGSSGRSVSDTSSGAGSGTSVPPANPVPTVSSLSPAWVIAGGAAFELMVNGANFSNTSEVHWNGSKRLTYIRTGQLAAFITAADIAGAGTATVTVVNPAPGGGTSSAVAFSVVSQAGGFRYTGSMIVERVEHTATLLLDGATVLITGGQRDAGLPGFPLTTETAELFDTAIGLFSATGSMTMPRRGHSAILLANNTLRGTASYGQVLITGGGAQVSELYDPARGLFTATGSLMVERTGQTATLLRTGEVLVAGGGTDTAELYDPASGRFTATTGTMRAVRSGATATLLQDGQVLVAGGGTVTAELYNPANGRFTATSGTMTAVRSGATATLLNDHTVLIAGPGTDAEIFDPLTLSFAPVGNLPRINGPHSASLLRDGSVLLAGGYLGGRGGANSSGFSQLFSPLNQTFTNIPGLNDSRYGHSATPLPDGTVLLAGGEHCFSTAPPSKEICWTLSSAEIYQ